MQFFEVSKYNRKHCGTPVVEVNKDRCILCLQRLSIDLGDLLSPIV